MLLSQWGFRASEVWEMPLLEMQAWLNTHLKRQQALNPKSLASDEFPSFVSLRQARSS